MKPGDIVYCKKNYFYENTNVIFEAGETYTIKCFYYNNSLVRINDVIFDIVGDKVKKDYDRSFEDYFETKQQYRKRKLNKLEKLNNI